MGRRPHRPSSAAGVDEDTPVDAPVPVRDSTEVASDMSPVQSQRQVTMDAQRNVLDRLEKARLIARPGPVDRMLETGG